MSNIKYPSTNQFRQVVKTMKTQLEYDHFNPVTQEHVTKIPETYVIPYIGTVKIHGTNGSVLFRSETDFIFQSKAQQVDIGKDNAGFAAFMHRKDMDLLLERVRKVCEEHNVTFEFPIEIAGEWAGRGIQKGVAVTEVEPFFSVFRVAVGERPNGGLKWLPTDIIGPVSDNENRIFNILQFGFVPLEIDFENPQNVQNTLVSLTEEAEKECPVGKFFGVSGVGEGYVWTPADPSLALDSGLWFKVKGDKHSVSKVKTLAAVDPERMANIAQFVDYAVTENRLEQALGEVGLDKTKIGEFVKWMSTDILKEEGDVMEASALTMKDVGKNISDKSRKWYMAKL